MIYDILVGDKFKKTNLNIPKKNNDFISFYSCICEGGLLTNKSQKKLLELKTKRTS